MIQEELFSEKRNLVYILVTDRCNVGCDFCMCNKKRNGDHMILYPQSLENLSRLTSDSYKIGISGQGEPLLNKEAIMQILNLPGRERQFDLITSGNFPEKFLTATWLAKQNGHVSRQRKSALETLHLPFRISSISREVLQPAITITSSFLKKK